MEYKMTDQEKQKLNEKLLKFAGFREADIKKRYYFTIGGERASKWYRPDSEYASKPPNFPASLDACFKWLVPKLQERGLLFNFSVRDTTIVRIYSQPYEALAATEDKNSALAFCLAIEKLIEGDKK